MDSFKNSEEKVFANALNQTIQIGPANLKKIKKYFGSFKNGWHAPFNELQQIIRAKNFKEFRRDINPEKEFNILEKEKVKILLYNELPLLLKESAVPPQILYVKGDLPNENNPHLAVVGPRRFSSYGQEVCKKIVSELASYNIVVVSGLAAGIDAIAHKTALDNKMRTIAVLGNGLHENVLFPRSNLRLLQEIIETGNTVISEYPLHMKAALFTFPQRNRIVAGMTNGTFVVEAPERSGSLITAFMALDNNREVFTAPGGIFETNSKGANNLIKLGALPITKVDDILRALGIEPEDDNKNINLSDSENKIISFLYEPIERDELIRKINLPAKEINPLLSQMEIKGIIKEIGGKLYQT